MLLTSLRFLATTLFVSLHPNLIINVCAFGRGISTNVPSSSSLVRKGFILCQTTSRDENENVSPDTKKRKRDKVMDFLRQKGVIGRNKDFTYAMGVDEGPSGKSGGMKVRSYFPANSHHFQLSIFPGAFLLE